jgi:hypothetical protein
MKKKTAMLALPPRRLRRRRVARQAQDRSERAAVTYRTGPFATSGIPIANGSATT